MKKNGFTLIELLGVITVLGIILLISIPSMQGILNRSNKDYYVSTENNVKFAGIDYFTDNRTMLPSEVGETKIVYLKDLDEEGYIDTVYDKSRKKCGYGKNVNSSYVIVTKKMGDKTSDDSYRYAACLKCDDYKSNDEYCRTGYFPDNNFYIKAPDPYYISRNGFQESDIKKATVVKSGNDMQLSYSKIDVYKNGVAIKKGIRYENISSSDIGEDNGNIFQLRVYYKYVDNGIEKEVSNYVTFV